MNVFVTGASGWIASAVIPELLAAGHTVTGLARSDASAAKVEQLGAQVVRGSLTDLAVLREAASAADGVVHLAFPHENMNDLAGAALTERGGVVACSRRSRVRASPSCWHPALPSSRGVRAPRTTTRPADRWPPEARTQTSRLPVPPTASGRRSSACPAPYMATATSTASSVSSHGCSARRELPCTWETAPTAGAPSTCSTRRTCSGSRWRTLPPALSCTLWATRGSPYGPSQRHSRLAWVCGPSPSPRNASASTG